MDKPHLMTQEDGRELVRLLNEAMDLARETLSFNDLYLHYDDSNGWRVRFMSNDEGTHTWLVRRGEGDKLLNALRAAVEPVRAQVTANARKRPVRKPRPRRRA